MGSRKRRGSVDNNEEHLKKSRITSNAPNVLTRATRRRGTYQAVFLTTELLENVLSHLPMKDLLLAQRVCQKWRKVIVSSKQLQQLLYMLPAKPTLRWKLVEIPTNKLTRIPANTPIPENAKYSIFESGTLNPLLFERCDFKETSFKALSDSGEDCLRFLKSPSLKNTEASWRRMLIAQPPIKEARMEDHHIGLAKLTGLEAWDIAGTILEATHGKGVDWMDQHITFENMLLPTEAELRLTDEEIQRFSGW